MRSIIVGAAVLLAVSTVGPLGAQSPDRCRLELVRAGLLDRLQPIPDNENWFGSGGVSMRCQGQEVFLKADSAVITRSGNTDVGQFIGNAQYRDSDVTIDADTLIYFGTSETVQAKRRVTILTTATGAKLESNQVEYLRAAAGRDTAEVVSPSLGDRTILTLPVTASDSSTTDSSPYLITSSGLRRKGDVTRAWGDVTVDRDSLSGQGDTLVYITGDLEEATLVGRPATFSRTGADSFHVSGLTVTLGLLGEELNSIDSRQEAHVRGSAGDILGTNVHLAFDEGELARMDAWGRDGGAQLLADGYDIRGDSIMVDTPGERLNEIQVFGNGVMLQPLDSTAVTEVDPVSGDTLAPIQNTIYGNNLTALFEDVDSAGTPVSRLSQITAIGFARALFSRDVDRDGERSPTINYTRADTIIVVMATGDSAGVSVVRAFAGDQQVDGIQLERASIRRAPAAALPGRGSGP